MQVKAKLKIDFEDQAKAEQILESIKVDDFDFVKSKVEKNTLIAEIESKSVSSMVHTLDDYLACISVASKVIDKN